MPLGHKGETEMRNLGSQAVTRRDTEENHNRSAYAAQSVVGEDGLRLAQGGLGQEISELLQGGFGEAGPRPQLGGQEAVRLLQGVEGGLCTCPDPTQPSACCPKGSKCHLMIHLTRIP